MTTVAKKAGTRRWSRPCVFFSGCSRVSSGAPASALARGPSLSLSLSMQGWYDVRCCCCAIRGPPLKPPRGRLRNAALFVGPCEERGRVRGWHAASSSSLPSITSRRMLYFRVHASRTEDECATLFLAAADFVAPWPTTGSTRLRLRLWQSARFCGKVGTRSAEPFALRR